MKYCSINGIQSYELAIDDRGLAYGDGIFTTAKIHRGNVQFLKHHVARLLNGCARLAINTSSLGDLASKLCEVAKPFELAVLKVMITTGSGGRGYSRHGLTPSASNLIVMVFDFPHHYFSQQVTGIDLADSLQQIGVNPMLDGIKHLNRLEQVLIRVELDNSDADDLVVTNIHNLVVETSCANLFYWREGNLLTPKLNGSGVDGLMRQYILSQQLDCKIVDTRLSDIQAADAMIICNSVMGIVPVKSYNGKALPIQAGLQLREQIRC